MGNGGILRRAVLHPRLWFFLGGSSLLFAVLPFRLTLVFFLSAAAHECGHAAVLRRFGIPMTGFRPGGGGAVLCADFSAVPYYRELLCAAAGPMVNVLLALVFRRTDDMICAVNILLACYNLLPLRGNDGAVMLFAAAGLCGAEDAMRRLLHVVGQVLWAVLLMLSAWVLWYGALADQRGGSVGYGALFFCVLLRGMVKREVF